MRNEHEVRVVRHMVKQELADPRSRGVPRQYVRLLAAQDVLAWVLGAPLPWLESVLEDEKSAHRCP